MLERLSFCLLQMLSLAHYRKTQAVPTVQPSSVQTAKLVGTPNETLNQHA